jgi:hypothetical protein
MVEMLARTHTAYELWMSFLPAAIIEFQGDHLYDDVFNNYERSTAVADRFMRLFLRVQRRLRDLLRFGVPVTINNPNKLTLPARAAGS